MSEAVVLTLAQNAITITILLAVPILGVSLVIGLAVSLFQAVTQISEMTLTFVPKMVGLGVVLVILGPWMLQNLLRYTATLLTSLPNFVR